MTQIEVAARWECICGGVSEKSASTYTNHEYFNELQAYACLVDYQATANKHLLDVANGWTGECLQ
jgi:hypothetical protein